VAYSIQFQVMDAQTHWSVVIWVILESWTLSTPSSLGVSSTAVSLEPDSLWITRVYYTYLSSAILLSDKSVHVFFLFSNWISIVIFWELFILGENVDYKMAGVNLRETEVYFDLGKDYKDLYICQSSLSVLSMYILHFR
jgi:hypothetical protein